MTKQKHSPSTLKPSHPNAFKSCFFLEDTDWDAEVKVDYDSNVNPININKIAKFINKLSGKNFYGIKNVIVKIFKTGKGHHLRLWFPLRSKNYIIPATAILRFQRDLDDDPIRQKFNLARVRRGEPYWNVLWNLKIRNGEVISKEERDYKLENNLLNKISSCI